MPETRYSDESGPTYEEVAKSSSQHDRVTNDSLDKLQNVGDAGNSVDEQQYEH